MRIWESTSLARISTQMGGNCIPCRISIQVFTTNWKLSLRLTACHYWWRYWVQRQEGLQGHMQTSSRQSGRNCIKDYSYSAVVAVISSRDRTEHVPALSVFSASTNCPFGTKAVMYRHTLLHQWQGAGERHSSQQDRGISNKPRVWCLPKG